MKTKLCGYVCDYLAMYVYGIIAIRRIENERSCITD